MQAPTTPSGPSAQEPAERACPGCGAANGPLAAFCWQCYRQFGLAPTPAFSPARFDGRPGIPQAPIPGLRDAAIAPPSPRRLGGMVGALAIVLAIAAGLFFFLHRGPGVELPDSFGGVSRISDPQIEAALDAFRTQASAAGVEADMAAYGQGNVPSAALIWVTGGGVPTADDAWSQFAEGFNSGLGTGSLDDSRKTAETIDGVTYRCAPIQGTTPGGLCLWDEDGIFWILVDLSGANAAARDLAVAAHDAAA